MTGHGCDVDVVVAGGGPAGLATAIEARLAGMTVAVFEPRPSPVDKACGEGLMPGAVRALSRLGVIPAGRPFAGIRYVDGPVRAEHRFGLGPGLGVRRTVLHEALLTRAAELAVAVHPMRVGGVRQDAAGVEVADGLRARWLIACDGLHSPIRRQLGVAEAPGRAAGRYGLRQHYQVGPWSEFVEVHWTRHAEAYVTPVGDDLVGVAVLGPRGTGVADVVGAAPELRDRLAGAPVVSVLRGAGPLRQRARRQVVGRVLLVGDASGYVDALTGEGIRLCLEQARAAVAAVCADRPGDYERASRRVTREYRLLTGALVGVASRPALRRRIVPLAARLPRVYGAIVDRLAGG